MKVSIDYDKLASLVNDSHEVEQLLNELKFVRDDRKRDEESFRDSLSKLEYRISTLTHNLQTRTSELEGVKRILATDATPGEMIEALRAAFNVRRTKPLTLDVASEVIGETVLSHGNKISAIKLLRERTGCGLREGKDAIESVATRMGQDYKEFVPVVYSTHG